MASIQKVEFPNFSWINIDNPTEADIRAIGQKYNFHPLDLADCLKPSQRSKADAYPKYTFLTFLVPIFNRKTREILAAEVNFFIGKNFLISLHHNDLKVFTDFFNLFQLSADLRQNYQDKSPERLLYEILNKLFLYCFPIIDHLSADCDNITKAIFSGQERQMVSEILIIRRNITDVRKVMQVHKNVLKKIIASLKANPIFALKKDDVYFESLVDYTKEIWDNLENLKERIEALQKTNESQISFKLSDTMRILTIISVITFPLTLIAAIFGMNAISAMPFAQSPNGFWYIIGIMALILVSMLTIFKKKGWL
ncbi:MAG: magnesium transporter CorA family protein [Patescibacteria group bacterium]|jgi:magnesium transporter